MSRLACLLLLAAISIPLFAGCQPDREALGTIADFTFTDQLGNRRSRADLRGSVWVASFVFTRCTSGCPQLISQALMDLQRDFASKKDVHIVSFTVDPEHDTPDVLRAFAESHGSEPTRWWWLTGNREELYRLIRESFFLAVEENQGEARTPGNEFVHSTRLVLVDRRGQIRGFFEGRPTNDRGEPIGELAELKRAVDEVRGFHFPTLNATLNAISTVLLIAGYLAIRRLRVRIHMTCMLSALGVSALFLASYIYYHVAVRLGQSTRYAGDGPVRTLYFLILVSHVILAAIATPMALFTAYQALRGRFERHRRIARWTLPIWLYVSVTGVVVYCMLYQPFPGR